ncbi:hypothetical protein AB0O00_41395, partial [Kitasatospora sp. NPDC093558]
QLTGAQLVAVLGLHLAAALVAAVWLRLGEKAVFRTLSALAALAARPVRILLAWLLPAAPATTGPAPAFPDRRQSGPQEVLRRGTRRRGPPLLVPAPTG